MTPWLISLILAHLLKSIQSSISVLAFRSLVILLLLLLLHLSTTFLPLPSSPLHLENPLTFSSSFSDITIFLEVNSPACLQASHSFYYNCLQEHIHSLFTPPQIIPTTVTLSRKSKSINQSKFIFSTSIVLHYLLFDFTSTVSTVSY